MGKKIIVIDNEPLFPNLIKQLLEDEKDFKISKITATKEEFLKEIEQNSFDVALVDISVGEREGGLDILQILRNQKVPLPAIVLSAHSEMDYGLRSLQAGARGYVSKGEISSSLIKALRQVCNGDLFVAGDKGMEILNQYRKVTTFHIK